ncbi:tol-pal system protein YbgF [Immundisolibacter sp.]|uniref:tol-pal system protein YbgF n=1 Tax=Immundisolibacter sp. TaxID=1934948 RepID=UPI003F85FC9E
MGHRSGRRCGVLTLMLLVGAGAVSAAPNPKDFDQRLTALEQAVSTDGNQGQARLVMQLQQMQAELRQLRGMVEEAANEVQQLQKRQREFYLDLDGRLSALEQGGGDTAAPAAAAPAAPAPAVAAAQPVDETPPAPAVQAPPAGPVERPVAPVSRESEAPGNGAPETASAAPAAEAPAAPSVAAPAAVASGSEEVMYRAASDQLRIGRYEEAIAGFRAQMQQYPTGSLADNAQYWIGEAYYVTRQFDQALTEFQRVPAQYPQSPKAADALLKIGYIQYERRQFAEARQTLNNLKATWPNSPAARLADNRLRRMQEEGV